MFLISISHTSTWGWWYVQWLVTTNRKQCLPQDVLLGQHIQYDSVHQHYGKNDSKELNAWAWQFDIINHSRLFFFDLLFYCITILKILRSETLGNMLNIKASNCVCLYAIKIVIFFFNYWLIFFSKTNTTLAIEKHQCDIWELRSSTFLFLCGPTILNVMNTGMLSVGLHIHWFCVPPA